MKTNFSIEAGLELSKDFSKPSLKPMNVVFNGNKFMVDLQREFTIDPHNLVDSMTEHAANYGWWAAVLAMSRTNLRKKKVEYQNTLGGLDQKVREQLTKDGVKVTEAAVKAALDDRPEVQFVLEEILPLEQFVEISELILKTFENKRDMLKEINRAQTSDRLNS